MQENENNSIDAILFEGQFINGIKYKDNNVYEQTLSNLKLFFLDKFKLNQIDQLVIG